MQASHGVDAYSYRRVLLMQEAQKLFERDQVRERRPLAGEDGKVENQQIRHCV